MTVSHTQNDHQVVIAGGGTTGMMLAAELKLCGVDAVIVERRRSREVEGTRARGLQARTLEVLDQRGIVERFLRAGYTAQTAGFAGARIDISDFPTRHPYGLALTQPNIERILGDWIEELGVTVMRGQQVAGLREGIAGIEVELADGGALSADYLVGCDGGGSTVRKAAGIAFPGWDATISHLIAEVELAKEPEWGLGYGPRGLRVISRDPVTGIIGVLVTEADAARREKPTLDDLKAEMVASFGTDYGVHSPTWLSRFTDAARQAESYRKGRVLLAGDAAHIHYPAGGHGLGTGVQDAVNLGWKLALVVKGQAPESLVDSYHDERHPVAARVLRETLASVAANRQDERSKALREQVAELLRLDDVRRHMGATLTDLDIRYELGEGHPLLGRRMPDLDIETANGPTRVYRLLLRARPVLLDLGGASGFDVAPWSDRVDRIAGRNSGAWELPAIGSVPPPDAVLVRPDGHVAWVGEGDVAGLREALTRWFGPGAS